MRRIQSSSFVVFAILAATLIAAEASERYPTKKRYVNQTGEVVSMGQVPQAETLVKTQPALEASKGARHAAEPVVHGVDIDTRSSNRDSLFGQLNAHSGHRQNHNLQGRNFQDHYSIDRTSSGRDWSIARECCHPGQPPVNEEPNS